MHDQHKQDLRDLDAHLAVYAAAHGVTKRDLDAIRRAVLCGDFSRLTRVRIIVADDALKFVANGPETRIKTSVYAVACRTFLESVRDLGFPQLERIGREVIAEHDEETKAARDGVANGESDDAERGDCADGAQAGATQ